MKSRILGSLLLACTAALGACATMPDHVPLAVAERDKIASTEIVAPVKQHEVYIYIAPTNTAGAGANLGLLGAVVAAGVGSAIDAQRAHNAETAVKPLRDALVDYNFDETLRTELLKDVSPVDFLKVAGARVVKDGTSDGMDKAIRDSRQADVLMVQADYQLDASASTMTLNIWTDLYGRDAAIAASAKADSDSSSKHVANPAHALYHNHFWTAVSLPTPGKDRPANIAAWSADGGKLARAALNDSTAKLATELAQDIQALPPEPKAGAKPATPAK